MLTSEALRDTVLEAMEQEEMALPIPGKDPKGPGLSVSSIAPVVEETAVKTAPENIINFPGSGASLTSPVAPKAKPKKVYLGELVDHGEGKFKVGGRRNSYFVSLKTEDG
jgi:hypothetical protein